MCRDQNAGRSHNLKIYNKSFERVRVQSLGTTLTNQNSIQEEIKSRLNSGNAFVFQLATQIIKIKIYRTKLCLLVCMDVKLRMRVFGNRVLRRMFGPVRDEVTQEW